MLNAVLGTTSGVLRLRGGALEPLGLEGRSVTALHASDDAVLAGTYGDGLFRSTDSGRNWEHIDAGLTASTFRFVSPELAGTEPARVYRSADGGQSWQELEGITRIPGHERWYLPYSPRAGAARNAYVTGDRLLVAAEVAGYERRQSDQRVLRVLTPADLVRGLETGRIGHEARERRPAPDLDEATARALEAFEDGLFFVFIDDNQVEDLAAPLSLGPDSRVRLVRLVALAGG